MRPALSLRLAAALWLAAWPAVLATAAPAAEYVSIPAGTLQSVLANDANPEPVKIDAFSLRVTPVTNAEFLAFVKGGRNWQRGRVPSSFADASYLRQWQGAITPGDNAKSEQAVVGVSWFAAEAFCENEGARLPTWTEWEYVAAADATHRDARADPAWRARILAWYSQPSNTPLPAVGGVANAYGVRDLHGGVWEWVEDFNALLVSVDSRDQGDPDKLQFCGAGAISLKDRDNYAVLMRIALLSSLTAVDTTNNLGFRCAKSAKDSTK